MIYHSGLASGKWFTMSLAEQLGNIGSEVHRAWQYQKNKDERFWNAVSRALELFDLTLEDSRWHGRHNEVARAREVFSDAVLDGIEYNSSLESIDAYLLPFALMARRKNAFPQSIEEY